MTNILPFIYLSLGLIILVGGADLIIKGAISFAKKLNVPPLIIGLTIIAMGTSLPELVTCVRAVMSNAPGLAAGNIIGSNIANILLILGTGAVFYPISSNKSHFLRDSSILMLTTIMFFVIGSWYAFGATIGILMIFLLSLFLALSYIRGKKHGIQDLTLIDISETQNQEQESKLKIFSCIMFGFLGIIIGSELLVSGAISIARLIGVSEEIIGLTMVAIGTSLPELATVIVAAYHKQTDLIIGNIMGSNIFNILGVTGATAIFSKAPLKIENLNFDLWIMVLVTLLFIIIMIIKKSMFRYSGSLFLILYTAYIYTKYINSGVLS